MNDEWRNALHLERMDILIGMVRTLRSENARLQTDLDGVCRQLEQAERARDAENYARVRAERVLSLLVEAMGGEVVTPHDALKHAKAVQFHDASGELTVVVVYG